MAEQLEITPMTDTRWAEIAAVRGASTPGRWVWNINPATHSVDLIGGGGVYVLAPRRWGFNGGTVWMQESNQQPGGCLWGPIQEDAVPHAGRKHHADWALTTHRPDAVFIANAGVFVDELLMEVSRLQGEVNALEVRRQYGSDIINDMTLEAEQAQQRITALETELQQTKTGWATRRKAGLEEATKQLHYLLGKLHNDSVTAEDLCSLAWELGIEIPKE